MTAGTTDFFLEGERGEMIEQHLGVTSSAGSHHCQTALLHSKFSPDWFSKSQRIITPLVLSALEGVASDVDCLISQEPHSGSAWLLRLPSVLSPVY